VNNISNIISLKNALIFTFFILANTLHAQRWYINISAGMINYSGDLQQHYFTFRQSNLALGIGLSYKLTRHIYINANYMNGTLSADDKFSSEFFTRNLSFFSNIQEGSLVVAGDLIDITETRRFTIYAFAGAGIYHFNPYAFDTFHKKVYLQPLGTEGQGLSRYPDRKIYSLTQFNIPFGGGMKYALSPQFIISFEIGIRKLFTDYLDDVSTRYPQRAALLNGRGPLAVKMSFRGDELKPPLSYRNNVRRGNPEKKDLYYFCIFKMAYAFNTDEERSGYKFSRGVRRQSSCPSKVL
jgi:hypothetical protein